MWLWLREVVRMGRILDLVDRERREGRRLVLMDLRLTERGKR
jgi:hypothetical protein